MPEPADELQFNTAETMPGASTPASVCARCQTPLTGFYYEAVGRPFCSSCKQALQGQFATGFHASNFVRAILFGAVGALGGALLYFGVVAATGYALGLIAIVAGYMVGWMVNKGARGNGGLSYQALALILTYVAVGVTYASSALQYASLDQVIPLIIIEPVRGILNDLPRSLIRGLIIGFALWQAWIMNRAVSVEFKGPFKVAAT